MYLIASLLEDLGDLGDEPITLACLGRFSQTRAGSEDVVLSRDGTGGSSPRLAKESA